MRKFTLAASVAAALLFSCTKKDLASEQIATIDAISSTAVKSERTDYLIVCKEEAVSAALLARISALGTVQSSLNEIGVVLATSSNPNFKRELERNSEVQKVLPDLKLNWLKSTVSNEGLEALGDEQVSESYETSNSLGLAGTNPLSPLQWSLSSVNAKGAFQAGFKGKGAVVAILDGGFHLNHPDLRNNIIGSKSFVPGQPAQMANLNGFSHGAHVAGIVAASDNNIGVVGIAPSAKLLMVKVLGDNGRGQFGWIIQGVLYAADQGADIINMSLGAFIPRNGKFIDDGGTPNDPSDDVVVNEAREVQELITALNRAFQYARKKGSLSIAAAGNSAMYVEGQGQGSFYPANCVGVVSVAANAPSGWALNTNTTALHDPSSFTNYGSSLISLAGPGGDFDYPTNRLATVIGITRPVWVFDLVLSATSSTSYGWAAGTSMACPAVSGVAALIAGKYNGELTPAQLEAKLKASAVDLGAAGTDDYFGKGQVNAGNAILQ